MIPAAKLQIPKFLPSWYKTQYNPAKRPYLQQVVRHPLKNPRNPQVCWIFVKFFIKLPLHLSLPPYQYLVQITDKGLVMTQLKTLDASELKKDATLASQKILYFSCIFSLNLRDEKKMELLNPVLMTLAVTPLQKASTLPSLQRYLVATGTFFKKLEVSVKSLGGTNSVILIFQSGCRAAATIIPDRPPQSPFLAFLLSILNHNQL